ncbi:SAM-dependent methyltransferase [Paracidovorax avenae]|nr:MULTISPECIES: SAM-dependent methyltransferase [unclassified Acidovorax]AVS94706.1 SAM-dependent methyltransferase [Paracidovorax avenae]MDA8452882.1 hypothetical protein [Acidovorax sp. GBBC 3297]MDA8462275.1 hypothetical protein [Acidovorax sp. GBBC 3333]MDA8467324.1 hypothetical protein [Acidovorax sp. GBBC 3332]MDA8472343.1 hypothetical protein [Acidovorax sp. GBBC 3299]
MNSDFHDAHHRHWHDAELLSQSTRWANADHLYGLAAECGLKKLMLAFGMPFDAAKDRPSQKNDQRHADGIWARYEAYRSGHTKGTGYVLSASNPFHDWEISQRYINQNNFDQNRANPHRNGAEQVRRLVRKAEMEGWL